MKVLVWVAAWQLDSAIQNELNSSVRTQCVSLQLHAKLTVKLGKVSNDKTELFFPGPISCVIFDSSFKTSASFSDFGAQMCYNNSTVQFSTS